MSKKIVSAVLLVLGAALASNCGGDAEGPPSSSDGGNGPGNAGSPGEAGEPSSAGAHGGALSQAGAGGHAEAGNAASAGSGGVDDGAAGAAGSSSSAGAEAGGAGGAGGEAPVSICPASIEDFPKLYAEAICRKRVQCCANDSETCLKEVTDALSELYPDLTESQQNGSAEPNCPALEQCVAAIDAADCSAWPLEEPMVFGVPAGEPVCRNIIKGKLAPAAACDSTYQCNNGVCAGEPTTACYGFVPDGQTCDNAGNLCNLATSYCNTQNKCAKRLPNGATCSHVDECQSRRCDLVDTGKCMAPASNQCEFVPQACAMSRGPIPNSLAWPMLLAGLVLTAGARRRSRAWRSA